MERKSICLAVLSAVVLTLILLSCTVYSTHLTLTNATVVYVKSVTIHALAVSGQSGEVLNITLIMLHPGDGNVYVATMPLPTGTSGEMFMTSAQLAYYIAAMLAHKVPQDYTVLVKVQGNILEIGGPSASAYMTAAMYALLTNSTLNNTVTMTGMILPGGIVGPVGGVPYKIEAAKEEGYKVVLVPALNYISLETIPSGIKVIPIIDVRQAIFYLTGKKLVLYNVTLETLSKMAVVQKLLILLWDLMKSRINKLNVSTLGPYKGNFISMVEHAEKEAHEGNYYTAASILYKALIFYYNITYRDILFTKGAYALESIANSIAKEITEAEEIASKIKPNVLTIDLLVGLYCRIKDAKYFLSQYRNALNHGALSLAAEYLALAKVRTETLFDWIRAIKTLSSIRVPTVPETSLKFLARTYAQFLKTLIGYMPILRGTETSQTLAMKILQVEQLYRSGKYLKALSLSFYYIFDVTNMIMQGYIIQFTATASSKERMLNVLIDSAVELRQAALTELYRLAEKGYVSMFAYMYIQYGNYYLKKAINSQSLTSTLNNLAAAMTYYTLALLHDDLVEYFTLTTHAPPIKGVMQKINRTITTIHKENITGIPYSYNKTSINSTLTVSINPSYMLVGIAVMLAAVIAYSAFLLTSSLMQGEKS